MNKPKIQVREGRENQSFDVYEGSQKIYIIIRSPHQWVVHTPDLIKISGEYTFLNDALAFLGISKNSK